MTMGSPAVLPSSPRKNQTASVRRTNKPLVEKKRRARINGCLGQLKSLLLSAMKTEGSQVSRLEKADILEMTVKYLRHVQCQQQMGPPSTNPSIPPRASTLQQTPSETEPEVAARFSAGYTECASEVIRYMQSVTSMTDDIKTRLENHLVGRLRGSSVVVPPVSSTPPQLSDSSTEKSTTVSVPLSSLNTSSLVDKTSNMGNNHNLVAAKNETSHTDDCSTTDLSLTNVVSPRHYQTALDLANMASNIVQQQQHHHQQQKHQQQQHQQEQQIQMKCSSLRENTFPIPQQPSICSNVAATPDTPPSTPPHMDMDIGCCQVENNHERRNNDNSISNNFYNFHKDIVKCEPNTMVHNQPSSSPLSTASSSSFHSEDTIIMDSSYENRNSIFMDNFRNKISIPTSPDAIETKMTLYSKVDSENTPDHVEYNLSSRHRLNIDIKQKNDTQVNTSPLNLIKHRLPLSAYATPLHIDIPDSPTPTITPSPPYLLPSLKETNPSRPKITTIKNDTNNCTQHFYDNDDIRRNNASLPTILYGVPYHPSATPTVSTSTCDQQVNHQQIHTSQENRWELDNRDNKTKCHSETILSSFSGSQKNSTLKPDENRKQTSHIISHNGQGHHLDQGKKFVRIDTPHARPTPLSQKLATESATLCQNPSPNPNPSMAIKTRHSSVDDPLRAHLKKSTNGFFCSQPPYATEIRKSPASKPVVDHENLTDNRNSMCCDQKPETNDIHNVITNRNFNKVDVVINNNIHNTCNNGSLSHNNPHLVPINTKQTAYNNQGHQRYHPSQEQIISNNIKIERFCDDDLENNKSLKYSNGNISFQTGNLIQQTQHVINNQHHRFSSSYHHHHNIHHQSSHPSLNLYQLHHQQQNFTQTHSLGMRSEYEPQNTSTTSSIIRSCHSMNGNGTMRAEALGQYKINNNKTPAIASVAVAESASRQNRIALLSPALGSVMTGHLSEVNSFSTHPRLVSHSNSRAVVRQEVAEWHESHTKKIQGQFLHVPMGRNPGNYPGKINSTPITSLDPNHRYDEPVWRPW